MIEVANTELEGVKIIKPKLFNDDRGYFFESFNQEIFDKKIGKINFVQDNESKSSFGVLRGLHYQKYPYQQSKLVRVIAGEIQDVIVDIRLESNTYLKHVSVILNDKNKKQVFIPKGFAHGFLVLSKEAIVNYKVDNIYNLKSESGIAYDDDRLNIEWQIDAKKIKISKKDKEL